MWGVVGKCGVTTKTSSYILAWARSATEQLGNFTSRGMQTPRAYLVPIGLGRHGGRCLGRRLVRGMLYKSRIKHRHGYILSKVLETPTLPQEGPPRNRGGDSKAAGMMWTRFRCKQP